MVGYVSTTRNLRIALNFAKKSPEHFNDPNIEYKQIVFIFLM